MIKEKSGGKGGFAWLLLIAAICGLLGVMGGLLLAKSYLSPQVINQTTTSVADISQDNLRQANTVIENAKKIIAGQENKLNNAISSSQNSIVGIFKKKDEKTVKAENDVEKAGAAANGLNISDYYKMDDEIGQGLVVTSDGWVLTTDFTKNAADTQIVKNFVVITKSKDIYSIDKISKTGVDSYLFIHLVNAKDLPVKNFVSKGDLANSQNLIALNWRGESYLTSVVDKKEKSLDVRDSDGTIENIVLSNNLGDYFDNAIIYNLDSEVAGFFDKKFGLIPLDNFQPLIRGLLERKERKRASLGVTYVNLEDFAIKTTGYEKGAMIYAAGKNQAVKEGSAAKLAGLVSGDIIISVDNVEVNSAHDLSDIIQKHAAGDAVNMIYRRNGQENAVKIKLGELK